MAGSGRALSPQFCFFFFSGAEIHAVLYVLNRPWLAGGFPCAREPAWFYSTEWVIGILVVGCGWMPDHGGVHRFPLRPHMYSALHVARCVVVSLSVGQPVIGA